MAPWPVLGPIRHRSGTSYLPEMPRNRLDQLPFAFGQTAGKRRARPCTGSNHAVQGNAPNHSQTVRIDNAVPTRTLDAATLCARP